VTDPGQLRAEWPVALRSPVARVGGDGVWGKISSRCSCCRRLRPGPRGFRDSNRDFLLRRNFQLQGFAGRAATSTLHDVTKTASRFQGSSRQRRTLLLKCAPGLWPALRASTSPARAIASGDCHIWQRGAHHFVGDDAVNANTGGRVGWPNNGTILRECCRSWHRRVC
jgi:hypothetical protein